MKGSGKIGERRGLIIHLITEVNMSGFSSADFGCNRTIHYSENLYPHNPEEQ